MCRKLLTLGGCLAVGVGVAACTPAVGEDAALSVDRGSCERQRVLTNAPATEQGWSTACWERTEDPEEVAARAAVDTGRVSDSEAHALGKFAVFSPSGEPCLDRVAVPPSARERSEGRTALSATSALAAWGGLPTAHRCGGDA